jgi:phospholipid/cholesterol/gamma-HCH transport system substrate-binding protein
VPAGTVKEIALADDGQALVKMEVSEEYAPLPQGTHATVRSQSLSGIANRYVSITPGPDNAPQLSDGALITDVDTTTPVDLDQLFNALREPERKGLQDIIQGSATVYAGRAAEANETYRYLSPALTAADALFRELNKDQQVLTDFLVSGARVMTAIGERRDDLSASVANANEALGAIASQNSSFDRALRALPPALRQANTTFSNLRVALDDLDPLVETSKTATRDLAPFLRRLKPVVKRSVPVFHDLARAVGRKGKNNDLADAAGKFAAVENAAARASAPAVEALRDSEPTVANLRPYAPELMAGIGKLGQVAGYYDADGHYLRAEPAGLGLFNFNAATQVLEPIPESQIFDGYGPFGGPNFDAFRRCPGGATQAIAGSNPFSDPPLIGGAPAPADCDPADVLQGP